MMFLIKEYAHHKDILIKSLNMKEIFSNIFDQSMNMKRLIQKKYDTLLNYGTVPISQWNPPSSLLLRPISEIILMIFPVKVQWNSSRHLGEPIDQHQSRRLYFVHHTYQGMGKITLMASIYKQDSAYCRIPLKNVAVFKILGLKQILEYFGCFPDTPTNWLQVIEHQDNLLISIPDCNHLDCHQYAYHGSLLTSVPTHTLISSSIIHGYNVFAISHCGIEETLLEIMNMNLKHSPFFDPIHIHVKLPFAYEYQYIQMSPIFDNSMFSALTLSSVSNSTTTQEQSDYQQQQHNLQNQIYLIAMNPKFVQDTEKAIKETIVQGYRAQSQIRMNDEYRRILQPIYNGVERTRKFSIQLLNYGVKSILTLNSSLKRKLASSLRFTANLLDPIMIESEVNDTGYIKLTDIINQLQCIKELSETHNQIQTIPIHTLYPSAHQLSSKVKQKKKTVRKKRNNRLMFNHYQDILDKRINLDSTFHFAKAA